ncbi:hypothetical protein J6590_098850 [Homalodisca vitripennis]|nr:hypothetical protein J6590_098850 [Homalodisca vitripennis]
MTIDVEERRSIYGTVCQRSGNLQGNAFAHEVWDSLADYPLNPYGPRRAQAGTLSDDILPGPCVLCLQ